MSRDVLDLFSAAAGGWSLGLHRAGFRTVAACEREDWRRALYAENNPGVILYDDVRTLTADRLRYDLGFFPRYVVGSPPCQDISSANTKGRGVEGERSGLYFEAIRIIGEGRPCWFALENSANLRTRGADAVIAALEAIGYTVWSFVVSAGDIGANHERKRSWLIGCDLEQVTDADGLGRDEGWSGRRCGLDLPVSPDPRDASQDGCGSRLPGRRAGSTSGAEQPKCGDATDAGISIAERGPQDGGRRRRPEGAEGIGTVGGDLQPAASERNTPDPDQARQAHGCMVPGVRQKEITDDGRGVGRGADEPVAGQMGVCSADCGDSDGVGADWSLADLADHLRLDDGLSARVAGTRIGIGGPKGTSAASLIVEAFGDAVVPQIPEAIGRAIIRAEEAIVAIYGQRSAAA